MLELVCRTIRPVLPVSVRSLCILPPTTSSPPASSYLVFDRERTHKLFQIEGGKKVQYMIIFTIIRYADSPQPNRSFSYAFSTL